MPRGAEVMTDQVPSLPNTKEHDLSGRIDRKGGKICLHTAAWMLHYKASTLATSLGQYREEFVVKTKAEKQTNNRASQSQSQIDTDVILL